MIVILPEERKKLGSDGGVGRPPEFGREDLDGSGDINHRLPAQEMDSVQGGDGGADVHRITAIEDGVVQDVRQNFEQVSASLVGLHFKDPGNCVCLRYPHSYRYRRWIRTFKQSQRSTPFLDSFSSLNHLPKQNWHFIEPKLKVEKAILPLFWWNSCGLFFVPT